MSNLYPKWAERIFTQAASPPDDVRWWNAAIPFKVIGVSAAAVFDAADEFLSDIAAGHRVTAATAVTGRSWGGGVTANTIEVVPGYSYEAAALRFAAVTIAPPTGTVAAFVIYHDTGTEGTSRLVAWVDGLAGGIAGLPFVPNGQSLVLDPGTAGAVRLFRGKALAFRFGIERATGQLLPALNPALAPRIWYWDATSASRVPPSGNGPYSGVTGVGNFVLSSVTYTSGAVAAAVTTGPTAAASLFSFAMYRVSNAVPTNGYSVLIAAPDSALVANETVDIGDYLFRLGSEP